MTSTSRWYWTKKLRRNLVILEHLGVISCVIDVDGPTASSVREAAAASVTATTDVAVAAAIETDTSLPLPPLLSGQYGCTAAEAVAQRAQLQAVVRKEVLRGHSYLARLDAEPPIKTVGNQVPGSAPGAAPVVPSPGLCFQLTDPQSFDAFWQVEHRLFAVPAFCCDPLLAMLLIAVPASVVLWTRWLFSFPTTLYPPSPP